MNFHEILGGPLGQRLAWTLLHFLWQGLLIGAGAAAAGWLLSPSQNRGRYAVAMTGLVLMACCPLVTFAVLQVSAPPLVTVISQPDLPVGKPQPPAPMQAPDDDMALPTPRPLASRVVSDSQPTPTPVAPPIELDWRESLARRASAFQPYAVFSWLFGVVALSGRLLLSVLGVRRLARSRVPVSAELAACANRLARRLGLPASPGIFVSRRIREAMLVGLWRPMVLLPAAWIAEMPPDVLEAVIAHELAHMRRLDLWANLLQRLVETLLFYHPAVWWLSRRASLLREMCADELAIEATGERMTYATALELLGRRRLNRPAPQLAAGIGGRRMALLARVRNVLGAVPGDERLCWWPAGLLALLVPLGIWFGSMGLCRDLTAKKPATAEKPKADGQTAKASDAVANDHERAETHEKHEDSSKPIAPTATPSHRESWPLSLKETLRIAIRNSKAMRRIGAAVQLVDSSDNHRMVVARDSTDVGLSEFEESVCNLVSDVETAYWELFLQYRLLETAVRGRDGALRALQTESHHAGTGVKAGAEALDQYIKFRSKAEECLKQVYQSEENLRFLLGIAAGNGQLIRPADNPTTAKLSFDWQKVLSEAIQRSPAIREARFRVKRRELELTAAEKYVLPAGQNDFSPTVQERKDPIANAKLALARERVKLSETEKEVVSQLSFAVIGMDSAYTSSNTNFNRSAAATRQLAAVEAAYGRLLNGITLIDLLSAQRSLATAEGDYYRSLTNYAKAVSQFHLRKGTLLEYCGIELAERSDQHVTPEPAKQSTTNPAGKTPATTDENHVTFAGLCHDEQGRPIADAEVFLYRVNILELTQQRLQTVRTDRAGTVRFAPVADLAKEREAWKSTVYNFVPYWIIAKAKDRATTWKLVVQPPDDPGQLDLQMPEGAVLSGSVVGPDGKPVQDAMVSAGILHKPVLGLRCEVTDSLGHFEIRDLNKMDLTASPKDGRPHATSIYFGVSCRGFADKMVAYSKVPNQVDVRLDIAAVIQGRVVYAKDGGPAAGVPVHFQSSQLSHGKTATDSEGRFRFDSLGRGSYNIWAVTDGYTMQAIDSLAAVPGTTKTADDLRLVRGGLIVGRVVDADTGRPFRPADGAAPAWFRPGVTMYGPSRPQSGSECDSSLIQADGSFQFRAAPGRNHVSLRIWDQSQIVPPDSMDVEIAEGQTVKIEFKVRSKASAIDKPAESKKPIPVPPAAVKLDESPRPKNGSSSTIIDPQLKLVQQATVNARNQLVAGEGRGTCRRTFKDKPDEKFDFEFAFDGDKFRFATTESADTHHIAVCDGSATLVREYYDKLDSGPRVAILKAPEFSNLGPMVTSFGPVLYLPFIDLPRGPRGICGKTFELYEVNVKKLPGGRLHGVCDLNKYVYEEFDATADSGYHISRSETLNKSGSRTGSIFTAQWKRDKDVWYVAAITREDWRKGAVAERSEVKYTEFKPNPRLPDDTFSIRSLRLQPGSTIIDQRPGWSKSYTAGDPEDLGKNKRTIAQDVESLPMDGGVPPEFYLFIPK